MSGYKYIQITQRQWNDVQNRLTVAKRDNDALQRKIEEERRLAQERERNLAQNSKREISALNERLAEQLRRQEAQLMQQRQSMQQEMDHRLSQQANELFAAFNTEIADVRMSLNQAISDIQTQLANEHRNHSEIAEFWLQECRLLLSGIKHERHHFEHVRPGQMAAFEQIIESSQASNIPPESIIAVMIGQFAAISQFRNELIIYENECLSLLNIANEQILELINQVQADLVAEYELDGESIEANMDFWTGGKLSTALSMLNNIQQRLETGDVLTLEELQNIIADLSQMREQIQAIEDEAQNLFSASEARIRTMQDVADALGEHGWRLEESIYVDGDQKSDLRSRFINLTGDDEIILTVGDDRVDIDQYIGSTKNEDITNANGEVVRECLAEGGLCQREGQPITGRGYEHAFNGRNNVRESFRKDDN